MSRRTVTIPDGAVTSNSTAKATTFEMLAGGVERGKTLGEFVRAMICTSFCPCEDERSFMRDVAERAKFFNDATICTYTKEQFVVDLAFNGCLREVDWIPRLMPEPKPSHIVPFPEAECPWKPEDE